MRILSLDPGGITGWAFHDTEWIPEFTEDTEDYKQVAETFRANELSPNAEVEIVHDKLWMRGELGAEDHHQDLFALLCFFQPDVLVCESFIYQRRDLEKGVSLVLISVEYIGVVKLWMKIGRTIDTKLVFQSASQGKVDEKFGKKLWNAEKLKKVGLWRTPNGRTHIVDATGHLLYYLTTKCSDRFWIGLTKPTPQA